MFRPVFEQNKSGQPVKIFWNSIFGENGILILFSRMEKKKYSPTGKASILQNNCLTRSKMSYVCW